MSGGGGPEGVGSTGEGVGASGSPELGSSRPLEIANLVVMSAAEFRPVSLVRGAVESRRDSDLDAFADTRCGR